MQGAQCVGPIDTIWLSFWSPPGYSSSLPPLVFFSLWQAVLVLVLAQLCEHAYGEEHELGAFLPDYLLWIYVFLFGNLPRLGGTSLPFSSCADGLSPNRNTCLWGCHVVQLGEQIHSGNSRTL